MLIERAELFTCYFPSSYVFRSLVTELTIHGVDISWVIKNW